MNLRERFTGIRIYQLLIILIMVSMLLVLATQYAVYLLFYRSMVNTSYAYLDNSLEVMKRQTEAQLNAVSSSVQKVAYNENIMFFLSATPEQKFSMNRIIGPLFQSMKDSSSIVSNIHMRMKNNSYLTSGTFSSYENLPKMISEMLSDYDISKPFMTSFYTKAYTDANYNHAYFAYWVPMYVSSPSGLSASSRYTGACIAICDVEVMIDAGMQHEPDNAVTPIIMLLEGDRLIYSTSDDPDTIQTISELTESGSGYQIRSGILEPLGWEIRYAISDDQLLSGISAIRSQTFLMMAIAVAIQLFIGIALYQSIARPLSEITASLASVEKSPETRLSIQTHNEIGTISKEINQMLDRIADINSRFIAMQGEVYRAEIEKMRAHILYLQMQINPHFLYNNLECIRGMIGQNDSAATREMVTSMAYFYRYCASAQLVVTVRQELDSCHEFATMIGLRFDGRFRIVIQVGPELYDRPCAKMTLQPLLENCILHGYKSANAEGEIVVCGEITQDDTTILTIADNGVGMSEEEIISFNRRPRDDNGSELYPVGMRNVDKRVRLTFGEAYGLHLSNREPNGLLVTVKMGRDVTESIVS